MTSWNPPGGLENRPGAGAGRGLRWAEVAAALVQVSDEGDTDPVAAGGCKKGSHSDGVL